MQEPLKSLDSASLHDLAGHILLRIEARPVGPGRGPANAARRPAQLDGEVLALVRLGPPIEQQLVGARVDHDIPLLHFVLIDLLAVVALQVP